MKARILTVAAIAAVVALSSCNKENSNTPEPSKFITIDAGLGTPTRATAEAFEKDDKISIYAWTGDNSSVPTDLVVNNSINTYDGTKWIAEPQMLWRDAATAHYFIGIHPTKAITDFTADSYTTPSDILVATILGDGRNAASGIVPLIFDHIMARLDVNLTFRSQFEGTPTVTSVSVDAKAESTVNYITKTATAAGTVADIALKATTANTAYSITVAPQSASVIKIVIDGKTYTYTHSSTFTLEKGKIQTVNLIVGRDAITLGSVTINDWATGSVIEGGEAQID